MKVGHDVKMTSVFAFGGIITNYLHLAKVIVEMAFTGESEDKLIEMWREHPCLYDISCRDYSNRVVKRNALEKMAANLSVTGKCMLLCLPTDRLSL